MPAAVSGGPARLPGADVQTAEHAFVAHHIEVVANNRLARAGGGRFRKLPGHIGGGDVTVALGANGQQSVAAGHANDDQAMGVEWPGGGVVATVIDRPEFLAGAGVVGNGSNCRRADHLQAASVSEHVWRAVGLFEVTVI